MRRTLLVTNDFPPRAGGIQSYVQSLSERLPAGDLVVYAPAWPGAAEFDRGLSFPVVRHAGSLMLPVPLVARQAAELIEKHHLQAVWFGAAAPLALLTPALRRAGIVRAVASTHGHEVGWSMLPVARQALASIGRQVDVITYVSRYARGRVAASFGPMAALEYLPPGVDAQTFAPDPDGGAAVRAALRIGQGPVVVCISRLVARKGQDMLIRAMPAILRRDPGVTLLLVGDGPARRWLGRLSDSLKLGDRVVFAGSVPWSQLPAHYAAGDVFAMPCRTRGGGLDVEGLGIVFLEASAICLPVVPAMVGALRKRSRTAAPGRWSTAATRPRSWRRSRDCSAMRTAAEGGGWLVGTGSPGHGTGRLRPTGWPS